MKTQPSRKQARRSGFTLIELLIVLGILVVLMSMVGPRILGGREKANVNAAKTQIGMLSGSLDQYLLDMRKPPTTEEGLVALLKDPSSSTDKGETKWDGPYINKSSIPKDPWDKEYQYEFPPKHGKDPKVPDIWSMGPDGEDNTEDDIVSWNKEDAEGGAPSDKRTASAN